MCRNRISGNSTQDPLYDDVLIVPVSESPNQFDLDEEIVEGRVCTELNLKGSF